MDKDWNRIQKTEICIIIVDEFSLKDYFNDIVFMVFKWKKVFHLKAPYLPQKTKMILSSNVSQ